MPAFSPELIQTMRAALDDVMTQVPLEKATPGLKAHMAELILKARGEWQDLVTQYFVERGDVAHGAQRSG